MLKYLALGFTSSTESMYISSFDAVRKLLIFYRAIVHSQKVSKGPEKKNPLRPEIEQS